MKEINYIYETYFKKYENKQKDKIFFKNEIYSILNYICDEIKFSKKFFRYKNGIEVDYYEDLKKFEKNVEIMKNVFVGYESIKKPQRISIVFAMQRNYLAHLYILEKDIDEVFKIIREDEFRIAKTPSLTKAQAELNEVLNRMCLPLSQKGKEASEKWIRIVKENPNLTFEDKIKEFVKN